jgi:uncharacterized protein with FMN-binding domain
MKNRNLFTLSTGIIVFILLSSVSCEKLTDEHKEAQNVTIKEIHFNKLKKGQYAGYYAGGMYGWRENECRVKVDSITSDSSRVVTLELIKSKADYTKQFLDTLYNRVLAKQTLQVDAVSGATLDSKACLKAIEDALIKAE